MSSPSEKTKRAVFDPPTDATCLRNYAEGARCGQLKGHEGECSQVSRWVTCDEETHVEHDSESYEADE